jgi:hypothetical protein
LLENTQFVVEVAQSLYFREYVYLELDRYHQKVRV